MPASSAGPKVEQGSTLAVVVKLSPDDAATYIASVEAEIRGCIDHCGLGDSSVSSAAIHEQIHRLKNALAPTGSPELLSACERLHVDAAFDAERSRLAQSYIAVANAALKAVIHFKTSEAGSRP